MQIGNVDLISLGRAVGFHNQKAISSHSVILIYFFLPVPKVKKPNQTTTKPTTTKTTNKTPKKPKPTKKKKVKFHLKVVKGELNEAGKS